MAKDGFDFHGFSRSFYTHSLQATELLDTAMNYTLMSCLGVILKKKQFSSISVKILLEELTNCPLSSLNATSFMQFWLYDNRVLIVKLEISSKPPSKCERSDNYYSIKVSFDFLCPDKSSNNCTKKIEPGFEPHFALTLESQNGSILQPPIVISRNNTNVGLKFNPENVEFVANAHYKARILVEQPKFGHPYNDVLKL